jgi:hypothetical protein
MEGALPWIPLVIAILTAGVAWGSMRSMVLSFREELKDMRSALSGFRDTISIVAALQATQRMHEAELLRVREFGHDTRNAVTKAISEVSERVARLEGSE